MDKRTLTLTVGVLLLFLPILPVAAAFHYAAKVPTPATDGHLVDKEETYRSSNELKYEFSLSDEFRFLAIIVHMGGCCPAFKPNDALSATVYTPVGTAYNIQVEPGECHSPDRCPIIGNPPPHPNGKDLIIISNPPVGIYEVVIRPSGALQEIPSALTLVGANAITWQKMTNDSVLLSNNIWWYYPDGSSKFVEDGGYFGWDDAVPRIGALSVVAVLGWAGAVFLLVRVRRLP